MMINTFWSKKYYVYFSSEVAQNGLWTLTIASLSTEKEITSAICPGRQCSDEDGTV